MGLGAGITGHLQAVGAVVVRRMAGLRGGRGGGGGGGGGGRRAVEGEGQVGRAVLLLAVREQLEVGVLQGVAQRVSQHVVVLELLCGAVTIRGGEKPPC